MMMGTITRYLTGATLLVVAAAAPAQETPATIPGVQPGPTPTPFVVPPPVVVTVPTPAATPAPRPTPVVTPTPRPTPRAAETPRPTPRATATPEPRATPIAQPTPQAAPAVVATPTSEASPVAALTPATIPAPTPTTAALPPADEPSRPFWLFPALLVGLLVAAFVVFGWRRRKTQEALPAPEYAPVAEPEPVAPVVTPVPTAPVTIEPAPVSPPPAPPAPRFLEPAPLPPARLDLDEPSVSRAGVNLVTATADVTVVVRNTSDVTATGIALEVRLLSAQPGQDAAIAALFAEPVERPATPRFDLAPGESKRVRTLATMPRDAITVLQAGERPMFVPVVAIRAVHAGGQTTSVHALGIERPGQAKLGPFWLDQPPRMFDAIGVRPHTGR